LTFPRRCKTYIQAGFLKSEINEAAIRSLDGELLMRKKTETEKNLGALYL
jgi:hypothetical protein